MPSSLRALVADPEFRRGARHMLDFVPGIGAWGLVTGVAMVKSGLSVPLALLMTLLVFSGSAQLAVLPLMATGAPMLVVWAAAFCVNLGMVCGLLKDRTTWLAAAVAGSAAIAAYALPLRLNIVVAIAAAVAAALLLEHGERALRGEPS